MRLMKLPILSLALLMALAAPASAAKRVALVIGNSAYRNVPSLANPSSDAGLIAETLRGLGFALIGGDAQRNLDKAGLDRAVQSFGREIQGADVALFYYAGHGVQVRGHNYLVPVGANPVREADVDFQMLDTNVVLRQMEGSGSRLNLVILDACRNNPFGGRGLRSASAGLAQMQAPEGTIISFATQPGNVALDGTGANSPFTTALATTIRRPGLDIFRTFNAVGLAVKQATGGAQQPWVSSSPISGDFYFAGREGGSPPATPVVPQPPLSPAAQAWAVTKDTKSPAVLEAFLKQFPDGVFAALARARLKELQEQKVAVLPPQPEPTPPPPARSYRPGERFKDCDHCPEMMVVPPGQFMMGSANYEKGREKKEGPQHKVTIARPFAVGEFEVTYGEFMTFTRETRRRPGYSCATYENRLTQKRTGRSYENPGFRQADRNPVVCVSWQDIQDYLGWLSKKTGKTYRLLSEAEWEYAARAGMSHAYSFGNDKRNLCKYANAADASTKMTWRERSCNDGSGEGVAKVGSYLPNGFGLYDMHGNVWEYVADCYTPDYRNAPTDGSAVEKRGCQMHITRGGSWAEPVVALRSAYRNLEGVDPIYNKGFRVARDLSLGEAR